MSAAGRQNAEGIDFEGKHYTLYEATQRQRSLERSIRKIKRKILIDEATGDAEKLQWDQIRLVRTREEYHRFSKAAGLPEQFERMEKAGFTWKHGKAAEKAAKRNNLLQKTVAKEDEHVIINKKAMSRKISDRGEVLNPMDAGEYSRIKEALCAKGVRVVAATEGDDLAYMLWMRAEGTYSNGWLRHIGEVPSRGTLFEEIIHMAQAHKYGELDSTDYVELYAREIEANRKLLRCSRAYRLDELDVEDIKRNLQSWEYAFKKRMGVSYDESNYRKTI